jgi:cell wall-associated NlpC family hydrolase
VLSATRRRVLPASLLASGALSLGLLGATVPAQAAPARPTTALAAPTAVVVRTASTAPKAAVSPKVLAARSAALRVAHQRASAVAIARGRIGARYVAGMAGPRAFDCSGLALYVAKHAYGKSLPHYSRDQFRVLHHVARKNLRPGDLVFFFRFGAHHVGVYIGKGRMVSATNPHGGVKIDSVFTGWYGQRYSGAARVV